MESENMESEDKLVEKVSLDWLKFLLGNATSPMCHLFSLINSHLMHNPWKMRPWSNAATSHRNSATCQNLSLPLEEGIHFVEASILIYCTCGISPPYFIVVD
jgi:hypothetical protein